MKKLIYPLLVLLVLPFFIGLSFVETLKLKTFDALVKAHTADLARQKFIKYFNKDEGTTIVTSCIRKPGYIEKQGGIL